MLHALLKSHLLVAIALFLLSPSGAQAESVKVAVAANFIGAMEAIVPAFEAATGHRAVVSYGSTGKLYVQIVYGAPFELFLAADQARPHRLHKEGRAGEPFTYAIGQLVLWSHSAEVVDAAGAVLTRGNFRRLAIANPKTAPYGAAAMEIIDALGLGRSLRRKLVRGDNIAQTYQFVLTRNAELGFIALSQLRAAPQGSHWQPPSSLYQPIRQDATLLARGRDNPAARDLVRFLQGAEARSLIKQLGYGVD